MSSNFIMAPDEINFLLNELAYCCWGIGAIEGCVVFGKADFKEILKKWSMLNHFHAPPFAISKSFYQRALNTPEFLQKHADWDNYEYLNIVAKHLRAGMSLREAMVLINRKSKVVSVAERDGLSKQLTSKLSRKLLPLFGLKTTIYWVPLISEGINISLNLQLMDGIVAVDYKFSIR